MELLAHPPCGLLSYIVENYRVLKWHADMVAVVALATGLGAILFATNRASAAVDADARARKATFAESSILRVTRQTIHLAALSGRSAPSVLESALLLSSKATKSGAYVVFVYTPGACERSIKDGLRTLGTMHARLEQSGIRPLVVNGADSPTSKELALLVRDDLQYPAPLYFTPRRALEAALFDKADPLFAEEPSVLLLDGQGRILSGIHTDQFRPELLRQWLEKVSDGHHE